MLLVKFSVPDVGGRVETVMSGFKSYRFGNVAVIL